MQQETDRDLERAFELAGPAGTREFLEGLLTADDLLHRQFISLYGGQDVDASQGEPSSELEAIGRCWETLCSMMSRSQNPRDCRYVARELEHVANLPGGEKYANKMAATLRKKFPSESTLHDELDKVGL